MNKIDLVSSAMIGVDKIPVVNERALLKEGLDQMREKGLGVVCIVKKDGCLEAIFTDGDLRRLIEAEGPSAINKRIGELSINVPQSIETTELLYNAQAIFNEKKVDCIIVTESGKAVGKIDIQDMNKLKA